MDREIRYTDEEYANLHAIHLYNKILVMYYS
jgi:hypothetical protein